MELRVLRYFLAVAQKRNITKAAQELLISQPTLSKQLADLEDELGVQLFIRGHRQITLTDEGEYLQTRAREITQLAEQTALNIKGQEVISGTISIGAGESIAMERIMRVLSEIIKDYSDVKVRLISGNADEMETALQHGSIDFAVLMANRSLDNYHHLQIPESDRWGLVMRKDDSLANKAEISPEDLADLPLLMSEQAIEEHRFQSWWGNLDRKMNIIGTYSLVFNAQLMVAQGSAYLVTFDHLINNANNSQLTFRPLAPALTETTNVIWKKNVTQSKAAQLFIKRLMASLDTYA
ncbi:MAG: LysR family transcriptional regulator [Limosilactobacillus oris]|jgi:DNA-binding transcriptional LysR family regulator|uniref:LysR family transcriptional regulator n=1 Tax=Limosilactobacillus oris TaxID=1632 RepID=UPI001DBDE733|nr:LysR family transcriptional regulator [Limosilactobacillus oris]MCH3911632.1 LysR family transcriptional regulator [Limosilactobacillus oris]MCH3938882.1 LysR family transcriptional regulator [Limosilactobacillus oris]MCI1981518.1 LysR family transcriptional regulator [Limosilactobacillus oris]MCI2043624.1 LysR family transcriptional regulator [Limosilactobacillus oris]UXC67719.1 LysR family transcriptional regulator [Limosilactobacillus oris]